MIALLLILASSLFGEITQSIAKYEIKKKHETIYSMAFLTALSAFIIILISPFFGAEIKFVAASIPFLFARIIAETVNLELTTRAIAKADRSTFGFLKLFTIPFLLLVDIYLGYEITSTQILGVMLIFTTLAVFLAKEKKSRKGSMLVIASALNSVISISLYKYDLTHFNSVFSEQIFIIAWLLIYSYFRARRIGGKSPFKLLKKSYAQGQSISAGLAEVLYIFAMPFLVASIATTAMRALAILWAIIFGKSYFHEKSAGHKLAYFFVVVVGLYLMNIR